MIVKEYQTGNGKVFFCDDCIKPKEEQERIMAELTKKVQGWLVNKILAKENEEHEALLNKEQKVKTA